MNRGARPSGMRRQCDETERPETMAQTFTGRKRVRKFFGKIQEVAEMPNLIEVQKASYDQFLQIAEPEGGRPDEGLQAVFKSVFPISDFSNTSMLEFVRYEFEPPKYDVDECRQRGMTYAAPLKVTLRLIVFDIDEETGAKSVKDIKEQDVYMGDIPLMTMNGTFVVNGTERVIVSQMHRSPGVFFDHDKGKTHSSGKLLFAARVIPYRGSWLDIEIYAEAGEEITDKLLKVLNEQGYKELPLLDIDHVNVGGYIRNTLHADKNMTREDALFDIYRVMRPGEPPTIDSAQAMFQSLFFDPERYDLSAVGRVKMNMRLELDAPDTHRTLRKEDILAVIKTLVDLRDGKGEIDDIV